MHARSVLRLTALAVLIGSAAILVAPLGRDTVGAGRRLALCVDRVGTDTDLSATRALITEVVRIRIVTHPVFAIAGYDPAAVSIDRGCPQPPTLLASGQKHPKNGGVPTGAGVTTTPSGYRAFVFVVPQAEIDRVFGSLSFHVAGQELTCDGDLCAEVSTAFYVSPGTLAAASADPAARDAVVKGLVEAVGLEPVAPVNRVGPQHK